MPPKKPKKKQKSKKKRNNTVQGELKDEQLDKVAGGVFIRPVVKKTTSLGK